MNTQLNTRLISTNFKLAHGLYTNNCNLHHLLFLSHAFPRFLYTKWKLKPNEMVWLSNNLLNVFSLILSVLKHGFTIEILILSFPPKTKVHPEQTHKRKSNYKLQNPWTKIEREQLRIYDQGSRATTSHTLTLNYCWRETPMRWHRD